MHTNSAVNLNASIVFVHLSLIILLVHLLVNLLEITDQNKSNWAKGHRRNMAEILFSIFLLFPIKISLTFS